MTNYHRVCFLLLLLLAGGCKTGKEAMDSTSEAGDHLIRREREQIQFYRSATGADLSFSWFAARGKASIQTGSRNYQVSLNLRMQKDKVIWASVTAILGLEVARAMITPDSILFFNRLERTYVSQDFDYLKEHVHPGISFDLLEAALTGNAPGYLMEQKAQLWRTSGGYRLEGAEAFFTYLLNFNKDFKVQHIFIHEEKDEGDFKVDYHNFETRNGKRVPTAVVFASDTEKENLKIQLTYDTFTLNEPQSFPFRVPGRYRRVQ
ncbi:MAG TPA: DUF4292 domain-containing protein [Anseongella sp.]